MRRFALVLLGLLIAIMGYGGIEAQSDPVLRETHILMPGSDPHAPPLRVVLVSDIHVGNLAMSEARLNHVVDLINAQHADAVLIAGDFVNGMGARSWDFHPFELIGPMSRLHAPLGIHAVLGNHDNNSSRPIIEKALHEAGVDVLHDRAIRIGPIVLIGMDMGDMNPVRIMPVLAAARQLGGYPVLMTHAPPYEGEVPDGIPLVLAGHTHCGQVVIGGWDNSWDLTKDEARFNSALRCGIGKLDHQTVVVTGGVGAATLPPIRLNAPPDFWVLTFDGAPR